MIGWSAGNEPESGKLTGRYRVRAYRPALKEANRTFNHVADLMEVRRQALKLRFWPDGTTEQSHGQVLDLDWDWVEGIPFRDIGELRIGDVIAGKDNLRIIFHVGGRTAPDSLPIIWVLKVFQKKRQDFSVNDLAGFSEKRRHIRRRFYGE